MEELATILESIAALLWPLIVILLIIVFRPAVAALIESARSRKFSIKIGGQELTMEEANSQQQQLLADLQKQVGDLQKRIGDGAVSPPPAPGGATREGIRPPRPGRGIAPGAPPAPAVPAKPGPIRLAVSQGKPILWVDDNPKNNSFFLQRLTDEATPATVAQSTDEAMGLIERNDYGLIISDMGRQERERYNRRAGLDLLKAMREAGQDTPFVIYCSRRRADETRAEAQTLGAAAVVSSPTKLASLLFE